MKIPNRQYLQQIAINHLPDIDFKDFEALQNMYCGTILIFGCRSTVPSDNGLCFQMSLLEELQRLVKRNDN